MTAPSPIRRQAGLYLTKRGLRGAAGREIDHVLRPLVQVAGALWVLVWHGLIQDVMEGICEHYSRQDVGEQLQNFLTH